MLEKKSSLRLCQLERLSAVLASVGQNTDLEYELHARLAWYAWEEAAFAASLGSARAEGFWNETRQHINVALQLNPDGTHSTGLAELQQQLSSTDQEWNTALLPVIVTASKPLLEICASEDNGTPSGKITLRLVIAGDGSMRSVEPTEDTTSSATLASCLRDVALRWRFPPPPTSNGETIVNWPFTFE